MGVNSPRPTIREVGGVLLVVLVLFVPEIAITFTALRSDAAMVTAGILPVVIAWLYAVRYALAAIPVAGLVNAAAVLVFGHPIATTVFVLLLAVLVGLSARRGLHPVTIFLALQPCITVISGYREVRLGIKLRGRLGKR